MILPHQCSAILFIPSSFKEKHIQDRAQDLVTDALAGLAGLAPDVIVERASRGMDVTKLKRDIAC
jgi:hypothetical protein